MINSQPNNKNKLEAKKIAVLECALKQFLESNILDVTMADIAKASGIGRATLYRYFENMEEIIFLLATQMMSEIFQVAFSDVSFDTSKNIATGYKNMISRFEDLVHAYEYMAMFDALYTKSYPSKQHMTLYAEQFKSLIQEGLVHLNEKETLRHIMVINLVMDFLEDLASHRDLIPHTQGVAIQDLLDEFLTTIDSLLDL